MNVSASYFPLQKSILILLLSMHVEVLPPFHFLSYTFFGAVFTGIEEVHSTNKGRFGKFRFLAFSQPWNGPNRPKISYLKSHPKIPTFAHFSTKRNIS